MKTTTKMRYTILARSMRKLGVYNLRRTSCAWARLVLNGISNRSIEARAR